MKKKNNESANFSRSPQKYLSDEIALWDDEKLFGSLSYLENERHALLQTYSDVTSWETEISYLRREIGIRKDRRKAHEVFLGSSVRAPAVEENFDNFEPDDSDE